MMKNTGAICLVHIFDPTREDGVRSVDIGNYWLDENGQRCVITSLELAKRYAHLVDVDVYVFKPKA